MRSLLFVLLTTGFAVPVLAQKEDGPVGIFSTRDEYHQFMGDVKTVLGNDPANRGMVLMINDAVTGQPIGTSGRKYGGAGSQFGLLADKAVREGLEMDNEQYEELEKLNQEVAEDFQKQLRKLNFSQSPDEIVASINKLQEKANKELTSVLLPHQSRRLAQIHNQSQLRRRSLAQLLTSDPIRSDLEVTSEQADVLLDSEKEIEDELEKQIAKLREDARDKLLSKLNPEQKKKAENLIGEAFDFKKSKPMKGEKKGEKKPLKNRKAAGKKPRK